MLFNSLTFLVFFAIVLPIYLLLRDWTWRKRWLLLSSYAFYAAWYAPYTWILLASTSIDWWLARRIDRATSAPWRKTLLIASLTANLGLLGAFKYTDFFLANLRWLLPPAWRTHLPADVGWVLPVGISFYTFASLSYTIDVYRREIHARASWADYALFVSFFPHLVAGPILRAKVLLAQIEEPRQPTQQQIVWGLILLIFGLFCKSVLADTAFAPVTNQVYANLQQFGSLDTWLACASFAGQIYFDFAGYSLCAIGIALCFGFAFPDNFHFPYAASGFMDFWRRWHISLSTWLRDYLYIPLGGNRLTPLKTYRNLFLTMLIGGLWHGASWMFVTWGALHGLCLAAERRLFGRQGAPARLPVILLTTFIVTLLWIPFRAKSTTQMFDILHHLFASVPASTHLDMLTRLFIPLLLLGIFTFQYLARQSSLEALFQRCPSWLQTGLIAAALISLYLFSGGDEHAFIYFQF